jgi:hypothetical protein
LHADGTIGMNGVNEPRFVRQRATCGDERFLLRVFGERCHVVLLAIPGREISRGCSFRAGG